MILQVALYICVFAWSVCGEIATTEQYTHSATLKTGNIRVYWKFNDSHITFEVHGETTGWIGIGFSRNGAMTGADMFVGWVKDNEVKVTDRHGTGNAFPPLDPKQDIDVLGGSECDGWTMFKFSRQLAACEAEYDREITQDTQRLIWAWGDSDPSGDDIEPNHYHGTQRGAESMYFLSSSEKPTALPEGPVYESFEILMDNFAIPAEDTYYNCKLFELPKLTKKHHIVKYEPIIQEGNELYVHHMLVYRCGDKLEDPSELMRDEKCFSPNMQHFLTCSTIIAEWAVGAGATVYPDVAGFSIGDDDDPRYIQIEVHYDNPMKKSGVIDSSGLRFTYTDTLREHDIGVLSVGSRVNGVEHFLPPGAESFLTVAQCNPKCLGDMMSSEGVEGMNVFSVLLHAHLTGKTLKLRHERDGVELPTIASEDNYDFNYQEKRYLHPPITLKPTDKLRLECVYNTKDKTRITQAGLRSREEMCLSFLYYYPKINFGRCSSSVPKEALWSYFGLNFADVTFTGKTTEAMSQDHWKVVNSDTNATKKLADYANEFAWFPESIRNFEEFYNSMTHYQVCGQNDYRKSTKFPFNVTDIANPYVEVAEECDDPELPLSQATSSDECRAIQEPTTPPTVSTTSGASLMKLSGEILSILLSVSLLLTV